MTGAPALGLREMSGDDLAALRLAAQVMAHRALLGGQPRVVHYFESLDSAVVAEQAARGQPDQAPLSDTTLLAAGTTDDDLALIGEYLDLLIGNERLSVPVREGCRRLRARDVPEGSRDDA